MSDRTVINTVVHGETAYDMDGRYAGSIDIPLSTAGLEDTLALARKLAGTAFDVIITSALKRTMQTAECLSSGRIKTVICELCNERNYGKMQGLTEEDSKYIQPKIEHVHAGYNYHPLNPPGGESFEMLRARARAFLSYICTNYRGATVLVVSHTAFLQQFHGLLRNEDWLQALEKDLPKLSLKTFHVDNDWFLSEKTFILPVRIGSFRISGIHSR
jgi:broad specificity phosphatase PhoE